MRLQRNEGGRPTLFGHQLGKYLVIKADDLVAPGRRPDDEAIAALSVLNAKGLINFGEVGSPREFFLLMLKDRYAQGALTAYVREAGNDDPEYAGDVADLARRSGKDNPHCKTPD